MYNILVADDVKLNRKLFISVLENSISNFRVFEAEDGEKAIQILHENDIDLIISDLMMPNKDGFDVLKEVSKSEKTNSIPVIIASALDDIESVERALELGAYDYFTKPLTDEQIRIVAPIKVRNAIRTYEQHKKLSSLNDSMKNDIYIAKLFQNTLIPKDKSFNNIELFSKSMQSDFIGGDFFDCIEKEDKTWFIIADVSGNGMAAALVASMIKAAFSSSLENSNTPIEVVEKLNNTFCSMSNNNFYIMFTAFIGMIHNDDFYYSNAGHPIPMLYQGENKLIVLLEQSGSAIGIFDDAQFREHSFKITNDDYIMCYTDGLLKSAMALEESEDWFDFYIYCNECADLLFSMLKSNPDELIKYIIDMFVGEQELSDDITLTLIKKK